MQNAGRSNVVMPTVTPRARPTGGRAGTHQSASSSTRASAPATRSNQYQPPSTNKVSGNATATSVEPSSRRLVTRADAPRADDR